MLYIGNIKPNLQHKKMNRLGFFEKIDRAFDVTPICALLGPRQCGKTTLARQYLEKTSFNEITFLDLEDPLDLAKLSNPKLYLENLKGIVIIDEIQLRPALFPILRVLVDRTDTKYLILGSASQDLIRQSGESLAGRITYVELFPFSLYESKDLKQDLLFLRGGFPKSYLSRADTLSNDWRKAYIKTYLEKDLREFGFDVLPQTMRRFWMMLCHYHGQLFNASEIGQSIQVTNKTASRYLDILAGTFMIRRLNPWFENIAKRQVKSPKIYFRDIGIFHTLLGIQNQKNLSNHPQIGSSWEGFALEEIIRFLGAEAEDCYFWRTQRGAELDLLINRPGEKIGFEFKYTDSPQMTKSMYIALDDLALDTLHVIIPLKTKFKLHEKVTVWGLEDFIHGHDSQI